MPYRIVKKPIKGRKNWAIIRKEDGVIVGRSISKAKAQASARARMAGHKK